MNSPILSPSLPPRHFILLLDSHSLWGAIYRGPEKGNLFVLAVIGWDELSHVGVPITSSSAGCRKREDQGVGGLWKEKEKERRRMERSHCRGLWLGRESSYYPSTARTGNTRGGQCDTLERLSHCRGFIIVNKSLLYMAQWRCPKRQCLATKSERWPYHLKGD